MEYHRRMCIIHWVTWGASRRIDDVCNRATLAVQQSEEPKSQGELLLYACRGVSRLCWRGYIIGPVIQCPSCAFRWIVHHLGVASTQCTWVDLSNYVIRRLWPKALSDCTFRIYQSGRRKVFVIIYFWLRSHNLQEDWSSNSCTEIDSLQISRLSVFSITRQVSLSNAFGIVFRSYMINMMVCVCFQGNLKYTNLWCKENFRFYTFLPSAA